MLLHQPTAPRIHELTSDAAFSDDNKKFLRDICKTDPVYNKKRIQTAKGPFLHESFRWILDHENFNQWRNIDSDVFWIKGDPGKGKTMLMCGIVDEFEKDAAISSNLSYFFCQATDSNINTATAVLGGLIHPLLRRDQVLLSEIRAKFEDQLEEPNTWIVLCDIFEIVISRPAFSKSVFVIDALDECIKDCSALLRLIIRTKGRVKWLLSSRNEKDIERELRSIQSPHILSLEHNDECTSNAIEIYINNRIQDIPALEDNEDLRIKTLNILKAKAMGTYLWVAIVVEQLSNTDRMGVEDALAELPKGLGSLYSMIITQSDGRLSPKRKHACQILLSIVTTAERPLHLQELRTFMSFQWDDFRPDLTLQDMESIIKDYGSILSIKDSVVYFIHQSARDYIIQENFHDELHDQHFEMLQTSLDAMSKDLRYNMYNLEATGTLIMDIQPQGFNPIAPIEYCCLFWSQHLLSSYQTGDQKKKVNALLYAFLKRSFLCWVESMALLQRMTQALDIVKMLQDLVERYCGDDLHTDCATQVSSQEEETLELRRFIQDAYQFLLRSIDTVERRPLQLYFSAMSFERANSTIRHTFEDSVRAHWGPLPVLATVSHIPSSLLLHTIFTDPTRSQDMLSSRVFFSPDSTLICSLNSDNLEIYRVDSISWLAQIGVGEGTRVAFNGDSDRITTLSLAGITKIWSLKKRSCIEEYRVSSRDDEHFNKVVALSPNGELTATFHKTFSSLGGDANEMSIVKIWRREKIVCDFALDRSDCPEASFSQDSQLLALADGQGIRIHNSRTGNLVKYLDSCWRDEPIDASISLERRPMFSPDSRYLIVLESYRSLCIWNMEAGELFRIDEFPYSPQIYNVAVSPDSTLLGICSAHGAKLWSIETGKCVAKIAGVSHLMAFSADWTTSRLVALHSAGSVIEIRRVDMNEVERDAEGPDYGFMRVVISPDSRFVAARNTKSNDINIWSGDTGQQICVLKGEFRHSWRCIPTFSPNSELLAHGNEDIFVWQVATGGITHVLRRPDGKDSSSISRIAFSIDSNYLVAGSDNIHIWCMNPCEYVYGYEIPDNGKAVSSVAISADSIYAAYLCGDDSGWEIRILEWRSVNNTKLRAGDKIGATSKIAFSSDSTVLVFISSNFLRILKVTTGDCLQRFDLQRSRHPSLFNPFSDCIFTRDSVFQKMACDHWEAFPRSCYSYMHGDADDEDRTKAAWIVRREENVSYLPMDFRPDISPFHQQSLDISDSLFAFINESGVVLIIKFPSQSVPHEQLGQQFQSQPLLEYPY